MLGLKCGLRDRINLAKIQRFNSMLANARLEKLFLNGHEIQLKVATI